MSVPTGWGYEKMTKRSRKLAAKEGISEPQAFARLAEQDPTRRCPQPTEEKVRQRKCVGSIDPQRSASPIPSSRRTMPCYSTSSLIRTVVRFRTSSTSSD